MRAALNRKVWLPVMIGILIAVVLFIVGENDDAPGLGIIGITSAIVVFFYGLYNFVSYGQKSWIMAIMLILLSVLVTVFIIVLALDGEFVDSPGIAVFMAMIATALLGVGLKSVNNIRTR